MRLETFLSVVLGGLIIVDASLTHWAISNIGAVEQSLFGFNIATILANTICLILLFIVSRKVPVTMLKLRALVLASFAFAIVMKLSAIIINLSFLLN
jgi:hypothetical protein